MLSKRRAPLRRRLCAENAEELLLFQDAQQSIDVAVSQMAHIVNVVGRRILNCIGLKRPHAEDDKFERVALSSARGEWFAAGIHSEPASSINRTSKRSPRKARPSVRGAT